MRNSEHAGDIAWLGVATFVLAWDLTAPETMSNAMDRYLEHPVGKYLAIGAVALTGAHLLNLYEHFGVEHLDPFNAGYRALEKAREVIRGDE